MFILGLFLFFELLLLFKISNKHDPNLVSTLFNDTDSIYLSLKRSWKSVRVYAVYFLFWFVC